MSLEIYTYKNPYVITNEQFWPIVSKCPYFCVSQTTASGLNVVSPAAFPLHRVSTIYRLVNSLYKSWNSNAINIIQYADIDHIIQNDLWKEEEQRKSNVYHSFILNGNEVCKSIRTLFELSVDHSQVNESILPEDQKYILDIYKRIQSDPKKSKHFSLPKEFTSEEIDLAIREALYDRKLSNKPEVDSLNLDTVVVHGVHQFSPLILRTIEQLSKYKRVVLIFNYQKQYKKVYQTWIDIYRHFEPSIQMSRKGEYYPDDPSKSHYAGNLLADSIGALAEGKRKVFPYQGKIKFIEFHSLTEFAGYVSRIYSGAVSNRTKEPLLKLMKEQFYSADSSVNEILKTYFPNQFGERNFLDYPVGNFFLSLVNMWEIKENRLVIEDLSILKECFYCNILTESRNGQLGSIFKKMESLFIGTNSIAEMKNRLETVKSHKRRIRSHEAIVHEKMSYYSVSDDEIQALIHGLEELNALAESLLMDFESTENNVTVFYNKIRQYLANRLVQGHNDDEKFRDIIARVLEHLNEVKSVDITASFDCLKITMPIYLQQEPEDDPKARWIVRNFEQIDGDILRSIRHTEQTYHFACVSDQDINATSHRDFSWPLDAHFFTVAQYPIDWKYQVYVESAQEYKNFRRYALLYGLEFNRANVKLSFIRKSGDVEKDPYYLLNLLGVKPVPYFIDMPEESEAESMRFYTEESIASFDKNDCTVFRMCPYRFLISVLGENGTVYKDSFLQQRCLEAIIEDQAREKLNGYNKVLLNVSKAVNDVMGQLVKFFPFLNEANKEDIKKKVCDNLMKEKCRVYSPRNALQKEEAKQRIQFLISPSKAANKTIFAPVTAEDLEELSESIPTADFQKTFQKGCLYCSEKDMCVQYYKYKK